MPNARLLSGLRSGFLLLSPLAVAACKHRPPQTGVVDPATQASLLRFSIRIDTPDQKGSLSGVMLTLPPDHFRIELSAPVGGPLFTAVSDGTGLYAYSPGKNSFFQHANADTALQDLTGGVGVEGVIALMQGRLPPLGPATRVDGRNQRWEYPDGTLLTAREDEVGRLQELSVEKASLRLFKADFKWGEMGLEELKANLPILKTNAEIHFLSRTGASPGPAAFQLSPPPGASVTELQFSKKSLP